MSTLTPQETQVLQFLAAGLQQKQVATRLNLCQSRVAKIVAQAGRKLGARTSTQAVAMAVYKGFVGVGGH